MPTFKIKPDDHVLITVDGAKKKILNKQSYDSFNTSLLGIGDIRATSKPTNSIAAVFDLEGFTDFSKQIDPHLSVPLFLSEFLEWLFARIKAEMTENIYDEGVSLYCPLPFFVKFMGDGLLVLWDTIDTGSISRRNIVVSSREICKDYSNSFLPEIKKKVVSPPPVLRCGLAMGTVYSVGNGNDFVGSCINMASRLQKISGLTFAFNRRGFDFEEKSVAHFFKTITVKRMSIRGIGDNELIAVLAKEYKALSDKDREQFQDT